jgi:hypothetical protein
MLPECFFIRDVTASSASSAFEHIRGIGVAEETNEWKKRKRPAKPAY